MRPASLPALAGSLLVITTTGLYLVLIDSQGSGGGRTVAVIAIVLATCAVVGAVAAWCRDPKIRARLLAVAGGALLGLGLLAIFSIGLLLFAAGALLIAGARTAAEEMYARSEPVAVAYILGGVALLATPTVVLLIA